MTHARETETHRQRGKAAFYLVWQRKSEQHRSLTGLAQRKQHGDKSNEMTLQECKLTFFTVVAAAAQTHETSLTHTQARPKTPCWALISHTVHRWKREAAILSEAVHLNLPLTVSFSSSCSPSFLLVSWSIQIRPRWNVLRWHEMPRCASACVSLSQVGFRGTVAQGRTDGHWGKCV